MTRVARPARLEQTWTDKDGRETRLYVPDEDAPLMLTDEIVVREANGQWRREMFADRPE